MFKITGPTNANIPAFRILIRRIWNHNINIKTFMKNECRKFWKGSKSAESGYVDTNVKVSVPKILQ